MTTNVIDKETVLAALQDGTICADGHGIYNASFYEPHFDVSDLVCTFKSDGTGKGSLFVDGELVDELQGVYNLAFLGWLHRELGITEHTTAIGRGFEAEQYVRLISQWANN